VGRFRGASGGDLCLSFCTIGGVTLSLGTDRGSDPCDPQWRQLAGEAQPSPGEGPPRRLLFLFIVEIVREWSEMQKIMKDTTQHWGGVGLTKPLGFYNINFQTVLARLLRFHKRPIRYSEILLIWRQSFKIHRVSSYRALVVFAIRVGSSSHRSVVLVASPDPAHVVCGCTS
jgi:hypothetical protein